jgi:hypothetical protein
VTPATRADGPSPASCLASTLSAGLELVKDGRLEARQLGVFEDVYLRSRKAAGGVSTDVERAVEALLFAAAEPLSAADLARRLPEGADVGRALAQLRARYAGRGVELELVADRWRFRTAPDLAYLMT